MANPVVDLLNKRHARRSIATDKLPQNIVDDLIEAARMTPSCFNNQPWRFLFLQSPEALAKGHELLSEGNRPWAERAPLLIIAYSRIEDDCALPDGREYHQFDLGMAVMDVMLAATHHDLVARPMAGFDATKAKQVFNLADDQQPLVMIAVGFPADDVDHLPEYAKQLHLVPRERKDAAEIVKFL